MYKRELRPWTGRSSLFGTALYEVSVQLRTPSGKSRTKQAGSGKTIQQSGLAVGKPTFVFIYIRRS